MDVYNPYWMYPEVLDTGLCDEILQLGLESLQDMRDRGFEVQGTIGRFRHGNERGGYNKEVNAPKKRMCYISWLDVPWIYDALHPIIHDANKNAGWNYDIDYSERIQFTVYPEGGFYGWHNDQGYSCNYGKYTDSKDFKEEEEFYTEGTSEDIAPCITQNPINNPQLFGKIRKLSTTVNITSPIDYEGGDLEFDLGLGSTEDGLMKREDRRYVATDINPQGSMVVFPSYLFHQVRPVTKGTRYSLVVWTCGEPYR